MASDGDLNVGISSESALTAYIEDKRDQGVYLSVLGFGTGNYKDSKMEALADNGNGIYYYIDGESEAEKVFGTDLLGTLYTVAEDVKLQLTFAPDRVQSYRLVGYENRILNKEDFEDDTKDAGEVGASHQVTVCYEVKLHESQSDNESPILTLAVRYKNPGQSISRLNEYPMGFEICKQEHSEDMRFICAVIETCMVLRQSTYLGDITLEGILEELDSLELSDYPEREEFRELVRQMMK
jgi:Ca-activated chloride channel family protein